MKTRHISRHIRRFLKANEAVSALEYAILVGVITVGVGVALVTFSGNIADAITDIGAGLQTTTGTIEQGEDINPTP